MISGAARGAGGPALGSHVANADANEHVEAGPSRGLVADTITGQVAELTRLGSHARTRQPIYHVHLDPPADRPFTPEERARYWERFEEEFGLQGQPFASQIHVKSGREHEHREYLRTRPDGMAIRLDHDFARREKLSRIVEWERGEPFIQGAHNRAVIAALEKDGREDVADAMRAAGMHQGPRPRAAVTPTERLQQDRTGISKKDVAACVAQAWAASDSGSAFAAALAEQGLRLAQGDKCPVIIDGAGNSHSVLRMLAMDARANLTATPKAAAVTSRLDGMALPSVAEARQAITAPVPPSPPDDGPLPPDASAPSGGEEAVPVSDDAPHVLAPAGHAEAAPTHAAAHATPGAALDDAGPGPGEPPGPTASPEELARFRARLAAYDDRKAAAWARWVASQQQATPSAAPSGGEYHGTVQQAFGWTTAVAPRHAAGEAHAEIHAAPIVSQDGSHGPHGAGAEPGHDHPGGGDGPAARGHHPGDAPEDRRGAEPAARPGSAAAGRDAEPDNGNPVHPDGGAGIAAPDRAAAGGAAADARQAVASRAAEARLTHGLAGQPQEMDRMRQARQELDPTWRDARDARRRIHADQARIHAILSTHPHPDPASRDPTARANAYAHAISERTRQRTAAVDAAQAQATAAFQGRSRTTRLLAFVGIATAEQRQAERLVVHAVALADASDLLPSRDDYTRARADGEAHAYAAQQTTDAWKQRPEVAAAMEQHRLNGAVHQAVAAGDQAINAAMDAGDPEAARAVIRAREHEEERRRVEQERLEQLRRGMDDHGGTRPPPPGRK